jgi:SNF2 family DNA or RNA helicase
MLEASEKLDLTERMMARLREQGHRVLIYSQFTRMLDILEEWLIYKVASLFLQITCKLVLFAKKLI